MDKKKVLEVLLLTIIIISVWMVMLLPVLIYFLVSLPAVLPSSYTYRSAVPSCTILVPSHAGISGIDSFFSHLQVREDQGLINIKRRVQLVLPL